MHGIVEKTPVEKKKRIKGLFAQLSSQLAVSSQRFGENKLLSLLDDVPVIAYTLINLNNCSDIDEIVVAAREEDIIPISNICKEYSIGKVTTVVLGGGTRAASVLAGMMECAAKTELIAVHDAARPFATPELISRVVEEAALLGACAPAVPVIDTNQSLRKPDDRRYPGQG